MVVVITEQTQDESRKKPCEVDGLLPRALEGVD